MAKVYHDEDADLAHLKEKKIAIIGYGSQGHAHALNLRDSGLEVVVGLYEGSRSWAKAEGEGLQVATVDDASAQSQVIMILVPDQTQRAVFEASIKPHMSAGKTLMFRRERAFRPWSLSSRTLPAMLSTWRWPTPRESARLGQG